LNFFSLLSLLSFTVYIYLGFYAFKLDSRSKLNRIFLVLCLDLAWWAFFYSFVYPAPNKEALWFWFKLSALGWCLLGGIALHLVLVLTQKDKLLKKWWIYLILYLPGIVVLFKAWKGIVTAKDFVRTPLGWIEVGAPDSIWWWVHTINYSTCLIIGIFLIYQWEKRSHNPIHKKQARIIINTVVLSFVIGTLVNIVFPVFHLQVLPAVAPVVILIWAYGIWRAVVKYRLMVLTPTIAIEEIISRMKDILILTNPDGKIIKINSQTEKVLGYREEELMRQPFGMICRDEEVVKEIILRITNNRFSQPDREVDYQTKNGELIPVKVSISIMKDKLGEAMGVVIIAEDRRTTLRLRDEITVRRRAEDALLRAHDDLEVRIQQRTDELFKANEALQEEIAERKRYQENLEYFAIHDVLTGLLNRHSLEDTLNRTIAKAKRGTISSLLYMDLDNFKDVNDTVGHSAGDEVLIMLTGLLKAELRTEDTVFRLGGDEFAVLLDGMDSREALPAAERLRAVVEAYRFELDRRVFPLSLSIGLIEIDGTLATGELLSRADAAMYRAKEQGKNRIVQSEKTRGIHPEGEG